jgi:LL-diaminopimelate aminotransferase
VEFARANDILICHDAPYAEIAYDGYRAPSILEVKAQRRGY